MATEKFRNNWIDKFNEEIERLNAVDITKQYKKVLTDITNDVTRAIKKNGVLTKTQINKIIAKHPISAKIFKRATLNVFVGSGVTAIIGIVSLTLEEQKRLKDVKSVVERSPVKTARSINKATKLLSGGNVLPKGLASLGAYLGAKNAKHIALISNDFTKNINLLNKKFTNNLSRQIFKDLKTFKTVKGKPLTFEQLANKVRAKNNKVKAFRVERIIKTELHTQNELVKQIDAKLNGYKFKKWVTQGDSRVRQSHKSMNRTKIPIDDTFQLTGGRAMFPGDPSLPPEERINERCFLVYSN